MQILLMISGLPMFVKVNADKYGNILYVVSILTLLSFTVNNVCVSTVVF